MNKSKGITLVALVITIVVLIILAGVGISLSLGENGIFTKAKLAKENYVLAANQEAQMLANLEQQIDGETYSTNNSNNSGNNNGNISTVDSWEYFYTSLNGFTNTVGTGGINSLFGLMPTTYEAVEGDNVVNYCRYEKELDTAFDLSGQFEISFKPKFITNSATQMGGLCIYFQKLNSENTYENIISLGFYDAWNLHSTIQTYVTYKETTLYSKQDNSYQRNDTLGVIGDGENFKFYSDDTLLVTVAQENVSFDKIVIDFVEYKGYYLAYRNCLERLYYGDIKYYKDII